MILDSKLYTVTMPRTKTTKATKPAVKTPKAPKTRRRKDEDEDRDYISAESDDEDVQPEEFDALDLDEPDEEEKADEEADVDLDDDDAPRKRIIRRNMLDIVGDDDDDDIPDDYDTQVEWEEPQQITEEPVETVRIIRYVDPDDRVTSDMLTGKECGRLIGDRARMLDNGAKPLIANPMQYTNSLSIATAEFIERRIPFAVLRWVGNNQVERWPLDRLSYPTSLLPDFESL